VVYFHAVGGGIMVSIHAPARGATIMKDELETREFLFQSTHPRGVRLSDFDDDFGAAMVSIHAPARGATLPSLWIKMVMIGVSIHAPARGATVRCLLQVSQFFLFQSTHPRGVRHLATRFAPRMILFQSTHPRGVRLSVIRMLARWMQMFQSTHPRGVRHF